MEYLEIVNWHEYQHYKERNPPWIKLHNKILDCYEYGRLQDASKLLLLSLYMLASRTDNKIPYDIAWIKSKAMLQGKVDVKPLIECGFVKVASNALAACVQNADSETETETYNTTEAETEAKPQHISPYLGQFQNVKLTKEEYQKLKEKFGLDRETLIENLSEGLASKGYKYKSHYATILTWSRRDGKYGYKKVDDPVARGLAQFLAEEDEPRGDAETR